MNYSRDKIEPTSFADDVEKMRDFILLSKEEFLRSYSYLTEEEYDLTAADILQQAASLKTLPSVGEAEKQFYRVAITETYVREVNIYAEGSAAAEELADELCSEDKIAIDYDHFAHRKAECQGISRTSDLELLECYGATGIAALGKEQHGVPEHPESFYLGDTKVLQTKDGFMCQFPDADNYVPLRTDIRDIKAGDAFMLASERLGRQGQILIAARDSHQNFDELDEPWIVYDTSENGWFEEDICTDPYIFYTHSNTMRQTPEQSGEKSSLSNQIRQAEARTTASNAEKKTHNIEQDR